MTLWGGFTKICVDGRTAAERLWVGRDTVLEETIMEDPRTSVALLDDAVWCEIGSETAQTRQHWPNPLESGYGMGCGKSGQRAETEGARLTPEKNDIDPSRLQIQTSVAPASK